MRQGEFTYLVGRTGTGKSSLLKAIYGEMPIADGRGHICGHDLDGLSSRRRAALRRSLGMVFQDFRLFEGWSVFDNLDFVLKATAWKDKAKRKSRILEVLNDVTLSSKINLKVANLSGGEKQRLAVGRALLNHPKLIIADEPTGNLDPETSDEIMYLLTNINKTHNTAVLFATHDYRLIEKFPNKIIRCKNRRLEVIQA
ncbi:UNVERIFIED_CONTAM: hypothetical protein GTU68_026274 [Idotea baltica]|nr:hypothetical protein [Idotea baltica]